MNRTLPKHLSRAATAGYRVMQKLLTVDVTHLMLLDAADLGTGRRGPESLQFHRLNPDQVLQLADDPANELETWHAERLGSGRDFCFAATTEGRLASYGWYALRYIEPEHNRGEKPGSGTAVEFPAHMAFLYKGFTHPDFRGQGIYGQVHEFALGELADYGVTQILATADWSNQPALRSCYKLGFRYLGHIWRFGWSDHVAGIYPRSANELDIRLGSHLEGVQ